MAVPTYVTDLTSITTNEAIGTWVETGTWTTGTAPLLEPDVFIQGSNSVAKYWTTGGGGGTPSGAIFDAGSVLTIPSPGAFFIWLFEQCPNNIATEASGGLRVIMGDSGSAFRGWYVGGSDTLPYGGWICFPVDPAVTADVTVGSPGVDSTYQWFGAGVLQTATAKGGLAIDRLLYGRGELKVEGGTSPDSPATFAGTATANDNITTGRWGLFQAIAGGYLQQGLFLMGSATNAVDFRDSNATITIANTKKVISTFNLIEIRNAASRVDWTTVSITALGTVARGNFLVTDNADVNIDACSFTDMGTFTLLAATAITNSTLRSCDTITAPGSDLRGTSVLASRVAADAGALVWNVATDTDGLLDNMTFSKGTNAHHAIDFGTSVTGDITLRGCEFTGFGSTGDSNDSTVRFLAASGSLTLNLVGCTVNGAAATTSNFSVDDAAGITVLVNIDPVTTTIHVEYIDVNDVTQNLAGARVLLKAKDNTGPFPFEESVSISNSGTTATVTHTGHGMTVGDKIYISDAGIEANNGVFTIATSTDDNTYTYTMGSSPGSSPTGSKSTYVAVEGVTDASGNISMTRVFSAGQPVTGWVRKSTEAPLFKNSLISGIIDSMSGFTANVIMVSDE